MATTLIVRAIRGDGEAAAKLRSPRLQPGVRGVDHHSSPLQRATDLTPAEAGREIGAGSWNPRLKPGATDLRPAFSRPTLPPAKTREAQSTENRQRAKRR
jgi:hypothetical protein